MRLLPSLVEVKSVTSIKPRSNFEEQKIEQAAQSIVGAEGIINPIVVTRTGINSFQVLDGDFEYYAAARAKEIDLAKGETIAAYIIEGDNEAILKKQVEIFRESQKPVTTKAITTNNNSDTSGNHLETRLTNLELRIENRLKELKNEYSQKNKKLEQEINSLNSKLPEKTEPLTTFNEASLPDLTSKLKPILGSGNRNSKIAQQILKKRPFKSLTEVLDKVSGLGDKSMLKIVDNWLYF